MGVTKWPTKACTIPSTDVIMYIDIALIVGINARWQNAWLTLYILLLRRVCEVSTMRGLIQTSYSI